GDRFDWSRTLRPFLSSSKWAVGSCLLPKCTRLCWCHLLAGNRQHQDFILQPHIREPKIVAIQPLVEGLLEPAGKNTGELSLPPAAIINGFQFQLTVCAHLWDKRDIERLIPEVCPNRDLIVGGCDFNTVHVF